MVSCDLSVIGNANVDLIALLDDLPSLDEGRECKEWLLLPGGSGSNVSVVATGLGCNVRLYAAIGNGVFSKIIENELFKVGVKLEAVRKEGEQSIVFIASTPKGKVMYSLKGVSHLLTPSDLPAHVNSQLLHVATKEPSFVVKYLKKVPVSYSPGSFTFHKKKEIEGVVPELHFLFLNEPEAVHLDAFSLPLPRVALVVTRGEKGSIVVTNERVIEFKALKVEEVVDTTGAGDAYAAAFLATYLQRGDLIEAGKVATAAGALAVKNLGGFLKVNKREIEELSEAVEYVIRDR
ncbi:hypothetical protein EYM_02960 [Ignicoccus islandicus DSM 13165]|uniref:Carbohydrate kinase PfkB domain-containing protein n=1 Tax=Ignicoccus islandicus DSM 13165 TaxID=940295 RepID=A0A0U3F8Q1_9CREN|nr:PfkB family carbohydrate kinase [Ignicoccus islandicus]ALU12376.1 hypothetical protein EYM_02960 [Ignicoccus islandicus DSM 13165]